MFDKLYFEEHFATQFSALGEASCSVILHNSQRFKVAKIEKAYDSYVVIRVYPEEGVTEDTKRERRKKGGTEEVFWDSVAVRYDVIQYVFLTVAEPEERTMGFPLPKKEK